MYLISHRARVSKYKENTLDSILEALKLDNVDGIEIDVRMTKDNVFVLSHNSLYLDNGIKKIEESKMSFLNLTKLEDVLKSINTNKYIILDLKVGDYFDKYRKKLMRLLKKYPNNYILCSFSKEFVYKLKEKYPNYKVGLFKGLMINETASKKNLDFIFVYFKKYHNEEGVWTIKNKEDFIKFKNKDIFVITDILV